jgi:uncharacterized membrane protein
MIRTEHSVVINMPVSQVFAFTGTGFTRNYPRWASDLQQYEQTSPGPMQVGTTIRQVRVLRGKPEESTTRITEFEKNSTFAFENDGSLGVKGRYRFEEVPEGTKVTLIVEAQPAGLGRLAEPMIRREMDKNLQADIQKLKEVIESA